MHHAISFSPTTFNKFILDQGIVGFFDKPIKLSSGRLSSWYVNWRIVGNDAYLMDQLTDFLLSFVHQKNIDFDCFYGTPDGATKLAVLSQFKWAQQQVNYQPGEYLLPMGRKVPKDHGAPQDRLFVGAPQGKTIIVEDVTTTGGSLLKTVQRLQELDIKVTAAIALTNRNEVMDTGQHISFVLSKLNVNYYSLSEGLELLPLLAQKQKLRASVKKSIQQEFKQYGQKPLSL